LKRKIENELLDWKNSSYRKPLILNGARQVGKTYILRDFGKKYYKNTIYVNLEINSAISSFFSDNISPKKILRNIEASVNEEIVPEHTLLIFDEIQSCERALTSLKYFCEETPEYHIATAGSLLGVAINREKYSFPVGKVKTLTLYPLDFEEYLWARNEHKLGDEIKICYQKNEPLVNALHLKGLELYREYLIIGG